MRVSLKWLKDYVDFDLDEKALEEKLVLSGTAVEGVHHMGTGARGVYTGQILAIGPHPGADRLVVCEVTLGEGTEKIAGKSPLRIVCGATNMKEGDKVPVALVGAKLPNGMVLDSRPIRGVVSEGMLCSEIELGLGDDARGLMILAPGTELGVELDEALGMKDTVLELEITPNRPDCMSMIGVAREVAALVGAEKRVPEIKMKEGEEPTEALAKIEVRDGERCPRYMGRIIRGVTIGPSPKWMQDRLHAAGMRPINNVVDVTNYVMLETGQPLHAFDHRRLAGGRIIVRHASEGERMVTLDGVDRTLSPEDLVIADAERPVALAGVMGSEPAEVHDDTVDILLESAYFRPQNIMATARGIGLITESSARFERGTDPNMVEYACDRAAALMADLAGGTVSRGRVDLYPEPATPWRVILRTDKCRDIIGADIIDAAIAGYLSSLELAVAGAGGGAAEVDREGGAALMEVTVPTFRRDLEREIDLIEEVARLFGYNNVPITMPRHSSEAGGYTPRQRRELDLRSLLMGLGFAEVLSNTLVSEREFLQLGLPEDHALLDMVTLSNPLGEEYAKLRTSLLPGMLAVLGRNVNWGCEGLEAFEIGRIFMPSLDHAQPAERTMLGLVLWGKAARKTWSGAPRGYDFFDLKGALELIWERASGRELQTKGTEHLLLHPGAATQVFADGGAIGWAGQLHPAVTGRFDLKDDVFFAELDLDLLLASTAPWQPYRGLPRYPGVEVDLSMVVDEAMPQEHVRGLIAEAGGELLADIRLFDLYRGGQIPEGKKSLAYALVYRSDVRTLTDEEVAGNQGKIIKRLTKEGIEVRTG